MPDPETGEMIDEATDQDRPDGPGQSSASGNGQLCLSRRTSRRRAKSITGYDILEQMKRIG